METKSHSSRSAQLFNEALDYIPGGVNSPVRAFKSVGGTPIFFKEAHGAYLTDVADQQYIDYVGSWGPMILGHSHPKVIAAVQDTLSRCMSFGAPCELEVKLARMICHLMPNIEKIRMVNSGTEATMTAIRLARAATGRDKLIKFEGCYHGHSDSLLVNAGSGALTLGVPSSPGITASTAKDTLTADFNDLSSVTRLFEHYPNDIAAVIIEPIAGNMNMILAQDSFLRGLRELCDRYGALLIFDEVMTGFRVALGGAQAIYDIIPDLTTLGKVIGGGMPVGAVGGKSQWMDQLAPLGPVYQAGTLSGNPIAMSAGIATLEEIQRPGFFEELGQKTQRLVDGLTDIAKQANCDFHARHQGGMFGIYFTDKGAIFSFKDVMSCQRERFNVFFHRMLQEGIYFAPSAFEAGFVSSSHGDKEINQTLASAEKIFTTL